MSDLRKLFKMEFTPCKELENDALHGEAVIAAAKLLNVKIEDLYVGNQLNTIELCKVYDDLSSAEPKKIVEIDDEFDGRLYLHTWNDMDLITENESIGVFFTEEVGMKILELNKDYER